MARRVQEDDHAMWAREHKGNTDAPKYVKAMPRLKDDIEALESLMQDERRVRSKAGRRPVYCFGDASAAAFGGTLAIDGNCITNLASGRMRRREGL